MRRSTRLGVALGLGLMGSWTASAIDYWDASVIDDNSHIATFNEMYHGVTQQHDLEAESGPLADEDWYYRFDPPQSSFEAVLDSASADLNTGPQSLVRLDGSGTTVIQTSEAGNVGAVVATVRALR